jgi:hypothetical protein
MNRFRMYETQIMARKLNIMSFLQQAQGLTEVTRRCFQSQPPVLLVVPPVSSRLTARRRVKISIHVQSQQDSPRPVKVIQLAL